MVAPLEVEIAFVMTQHVHDEMCSRTTVINISENVELVNAEFLYHIAESHNKSVGLTGGYDGLDDAVEIVLLVEIGRRFMKQLLNDISKFARESLTYLGASVFGRNCLTNADELMKSYKIEVIKVTFAGTDNLELSFGIIYERA